MSRKLVGVIGAQGAGKDFIMNLLQSRLIHQHRYIMSTVRCRFADALNEAVAPILGISGKELQDRELKEKPRFIFDNPKRVTARTWSSRDVQKEVGRLLRDNLGKDVFVNALDRKYSNPSAILLISDLRYQNELDWVREQGGKIVYIHNEKAAQTQYEQERANTTFMPHHPPESEVLQWDFYSRIETPDYWLDNNDFAATQPFDDFVKFVVDYLEEK